MKKEKLIKITKLLFITIILTILGFVFNGQSFKSNVNTYIVESKNLNISNTVTDESCFEFDSANHKITGYLGITQYCPTNIEIPDTIENVSVEVIGDNAFRIQA